VRQKTKKTFGGSKRNGKTEAKTPQNNQCLTSLGSTTRKRFADDLPGHEKWSKHIELTRGKWKKEETTTRKRGKKKRGKFPGEVPSFEGKKSREPCERKNEKKGGKLPTTTNRRSPPPIEKMGVLKRGNIKDMSRLTKYQKTNRRQASEEGRRIRKKISTKSKLQEHIRNNSNGVSRDGSGQARGKNFCARKTKKKEPINGGGELDEGPQTVAEKL